MATASPAIPPMPGPDVPLTIEGGVINPVWFKWLVAFVSIMRTIRSEIP